MAVWRDFKSFIARGNVIDIAVGMIIGAAFTTIVKSLVDDIIMPVVGIFTQGMDFTNMFINLSGGDFGTLKEAQDAGAATINYGMFLNSVVYFFIVAMIVFAMVKGLSALKDKAENPKDHSIKTPRDIELLSEIRDALVNKEKEQG